MSDSQDQPDTSEPTTPTRQGKIGFGTVSILMIFFAILGAMCVGSVLIVAVLAFR